MSDGTLPGVRTTDADDMHDSPNARDTLIQRIGRLLAADPVLAGVAWDGYALIARYDEAGTASRRLSGFRYLDDGGFEAATPSDPALGDALDALREATRVAARAPWDACVVRLRHDTGKLHAEFEYDDPGRWDIAPGTLHDVVERARPPKG